MSSRATGSYNRDLRGLDRCYLVFYLRVFDGMSCRILGHLLDISEKGLKLLCESPVELDRKYRLRMRLPSPLKDRNEIIIDATSRWCIADENAGFYQAGFQIKGLCSRSTTLISNLIRDFSYRKSAP
ncbi:PilZ domain-containing protein [Desulforhopalus singaporensis]|uniref:PilZ domain-containing protein n=1 Tax=Desulforhopalus singaporensis TaxID=91360 RepID=A0A1H0JM61_9BACT|nr:PilZ domain-containing protein [Desulforhopalus singaporensis]SDO44796.1 PilZ domain-containing protein [Desulforhopalus singaporensis]